MPGPLPAAALQVVSAGPSGRRQLGGLGGDPRAVGGGSPSRVRGWGDPRAVRGQAEGRAWGGGAPHTRGEGSMGTEGDRPAGGGEGSRQGKVLRTGS